MALSNDEIYILRTFAHLKRGTISPHIKHEIQTLVDAGYLETYEVPGTPTVYEINNAGRARVALETT